MYFVILWQHRRLINPVVPELGRPATMSDGFDFINEAIDIRHNTESVEHLEFLTESFEPEFWSEPIPRLKICSSLF